MSIHWRISIHSTYSKTCELNPSPYRELSLPNHQFLLLQNIEGKRTSQQLAGTLCHFVSFFLHSQQTFLSTMCCEYIEKKASGSKSLSKGHVVATYQNCRSRQLIFPRQANDFSFQIISRFLHKKRMDFPGPQGKTIKNKDQHDQQTPWPKKTSEYYRHKKTCNLQVKEFMKCLSHPLHKK